MRDLSLDLSRVLACIAVVATHTLMLFWDFDPARPLWAVYNFLALALRCCVPLFFLVSGALLLGREELPRPKLLRRVLHLTLLFYVWSLICRGIDAGFLHLWEAEGDFVSLVLAGYYHLWFLPAMALCSCALPLLHGLAYGKKDEVFFGALLLLALVLLLSTLEAIPVKSARLAAFLSAWRLRDLRYLIYMPVGWLFSRRRLTGRQLTALGLAALAALLVSARLNRVLALRAGMAVDTLYGNLTVSAGLTALFLFCLCRRLKSLPERAARLLRTLSDCSLGVYLMHPILIDALRSRHLDLAQYSAAWLLPLCLLCFLLGSFALSRALRRIPFLRQLVS